MLSPGARPVASLPADFLVRAPCLFTSASSLARNLETRLAHFASPLRLLAPPFAGPPGHRAVDLATRLIHCPPRVDARPRRLAHRVRAGTTGLASPLAL